MSRWGDTPPFITTPRTKPPTPQRGGNGRNPHNEKPTQKAGRGSLIFDVMGFPRLPKDGKGVIDNQYCG